MVQIMYTHLRTCLLKMFMSAKPAVAIKALPRPVRSKETSVSVAVATPSTIHLYAQQRQFFYAAGINSLAILFIGEFSPIGDKSFHNIMVNFSPC